MKRIRVNDAGQARAALTAARQLGCGVVLVSPAAPWAGIGWWQRLVADAAAEFPDVRFEAVLDCGPSAGMALAAIRCGAGPLEASVDTATLAKLADIARQVGTTVSGGGDPTLDLPGTSAPIQACLDWLVAEGATP